VCRAYCDHRLVNPDADFSSLSHTYRLLISIRSFRSFAHLFICSFVHHFLGLIICLGLDVVVIFGVHVIIVRVMPLDPSSQESKTLISTFFFL